MAGGGIQPGIVYGETDDFSYNITRDPVHIHDLTMNQVQSRLLPDRDLLPARGHQQQGLSTGIADHVDLAIPGEITRHCRVAMFSLVNHMPGPGTGLCMDAGKREQKPH